MKKSLTEIAAVYPVAGISLEIEVESFRLYRKLINGAIFGELIADINK